MVPGSSPYSPPAVTSAYGLSAQVLNCTNAGSRTDNAFAMVIQLKHVGEFNDSWDGTVALSINGVEVGSTNILNNFYYMWLYGPSVKNATASQLAQLALYPPDKPILAEILIPRTLAPKYDCQLNLVTPIIR